MSNQTVSTQQIKKLRQETGAGIADVREALEKNGGNVEKARQWLEKKLGASALKKANRSTTAGIIDSYIHSNGRIGAMVEVMCETDFVARNPQFKEFVHNIAMHIAAMAPVYISLDTVPEDVLSVERKRLEKEVETLDKPVDIKRQIVEGKLKSQLAEITLLEQPFVKDQDKSVGELINESIGKFGENIKIARFVRFEIS